MQTKVNQLKTMLLGSGVVILAGDGPQSHNSAYNQEGGLLHVGEDDEPLGLLGGRRPRDSTVIQVYCWFTLLHRPSIRGQKPRSWRTRVIVTSHFMKMRTLQMLHAVDNFASS